MHQSIKFILFWNDTLHGSDGLSIYHQEFKTVHRAVKVCSLDTPDDGRKDRSKHVECHSKLK